MAVWLLIVTQYLKKITPREETNMTTLMSYDEVVQCVQHELELTGIADKKHAKPDLSHLLPELKFVIFSSFPHG